MTLQVPGLVGPVSASTAASAQLPSAPRQRVQPQQQQQLAGKGQTAADRQAVRRQPQAQQQPGARAAANTRNAAAKQKQQPAQQKNKQPPRGKGQNHRAAAAAQQEDPDAIEADCDAMSPFAAADWRFDFQTEGGVMHAAPGAAVQPPAGSRSPNFRTGQVFEVPQDGGVDAVPYPPVAVAAGVPQSVGYYGPIGSPGTRCTTVVTGVPALQQPAQHVGWQQQGSPQAAQVGNSCPAAIVTIVACTCTSHTQ